MAVCTEVRFQLKQLRWEIPASPEAKRIAAGVVGQLTVYCEEHVCFDEGDVPVVDLAVLLARWLKNGAVDPFEYRSVEAEESIIEFAPTADWHWRVVSEFHGGEGCGPVSSAALTEAVRSFLIGIKRALRDDLSVRWEESLERLV